MDAPTLPHRVQRRRTKGHWLPPDTVSVTRPGKWGNPFQVGVPYTNFDWLAIWLPDQAPFENSPGAEGFVCNTIAQALEMFEVHLRKSIECHPEIYNLSELRGKNLACYCRSSEPCHADILLKYANLWAVSLGI